MSEVIKDTLSKTGMPKAVKDAKTAKDIIDQAGAGVTVPPRGPNRGMFGGLVSGGGGGGGGGGFERVGMLPDEAQKLLQESIQKNTDLIAEAYKSLADLIKENSGQIETAYEQSVRELNERIGGMAKQFQDAMAGILKIQNVGSIADLQKVIDHWIRNYGTIGQDAAKGAQAAIKQYRELEQALKDLGVQADIAKKKLEQDFFKSILEQWNDL